MLDARIGSVCRAEKRKVKTYEDTAADVLEEMVCLVSLGMIEEWILARPPEGSSEAEYYDRMEKEALECMSIGDRFDRIMKSKGSIVFPLKTDVSGDSLSLLDRYLPDKCAGAKAWREEIIDCVLKFRSGKKDIVTIEKNMRDSAYEAEKGKIVFDNDANGLVILNLVLYELERLMGIVQ